MSAASPSSAVLVFGRALLGVGAAGLLQGALAIIGYVVPLEKVPAFQGIVVSAMGISVCIGPVIGGAITEYVKWRKLHHFIVLQRITSMIFTDRLLRLVFLDVGPPSSLLLF